MESAPDVKDAYVRFLAALAAGDVPAFRSCFSEQPGTLFFGSAAEEWMAGPEAIAAFVAEVIPAVHQAGLSFHPGDAQAFREGSVGWVADRMTIRAAGGAEQEVRATAVFRLENGAWKAVLYGHSLAVPDDQVEVFRDLLG